jgi:hypothetical protein
MWGAISLATSKDGRPRAGHLLCWRDQPVRNGSLIAGTLAEGSQTNSAARDQVEVKRSVSIVEKSADANRANPISMHAGE